MFIARVSRGRTVREFLTCVILIPTFVSIVWMGAFGGIAVSQVMADASAPVLGVAQELKLFVMLEQLPLTAITSLLGIVLVLVFFVTSSDSGSLVIDTITAGGKVDAPVPQRVFWASFEGLVALALLLGGGLALLLPGAGATIGATLLLVGGNSALTALQAMAVSTGFPFTVVLLAMCVSLYIGMRRYLKATS